ncbi:STAS domain-containing protein [Streptomyces sp. NBC_01278]|uniref:STAS domain-containing protein n=1 Tax=Streptomyces sp. NBC_01278 TaxID=2903809 RepID=UPI002E35A1D1|nr:STAS domain-containing protein [Streptomyces sp. NBC_01278]
MHDIDDYPQARTIPGLLIYHHDSPLYFANADNFRRRALAAVDEQCGGVRWFVLNTEADVEVDITALDAVESLRNELDRRGVIYFGTWLRALEPVAKATAGAQERTEQRRRRPSASVGMRQSRPPAGGSWLRSALIPKTWILLGASLGMSVRSATTALVMSRSVFGRRAIWVALSRCSG